MSDYLGFTGEYPMQCPYNPGHYMITNGQMRRHLESCRQSYILTLTAEGRAEDANLKRCTYNPAHAIPEVELDMHEMLCEDFMPVPMSEESEDDSGQGNEEESVEGRLEGAASASGAGEGNQHAGTGTGNWVAIEFPMDYDGNAIGSEERKAAFEKWKQEFWGKDYANADKQAVQVQEEQADESSDLSEEDLEEIFADFEKNQENYSDGSQAPPGSGPFIFF